MEDESQEHLETLLRIWKKRLRLEHWEIKIEYRRAYDMAEGVEGNCRKMPSLLRATISVLDRKDVDPDPSLFTHRLEYIVVHELLHLHFNPFCRSGETEWEQQVEEQSIHSLAMAFTKED